MSLVVARRETTQICAERQEETILRLNIWVWARHTGVKLRVESSLTRHSLLWEKSRERQHGQFPPFTHLDHKTPELENNSRVESFQVAVTLVLCQVYYSLLTKLQMVFTTQQNGKEKRNVLCWFSRHVVCKT